jgi:hypothetical protein
MGRRRQGIIRKGDEKEISKLLKTEKVPKHGADKKSSAADDQLGKRAKIPPEPQKPSVNSKFTATKGRLSRS